MNYSTEDGHKQVPGTTEWLDSYPLTCGDLNNYIATAFELQNQIDWSLKFP